MKTQLTAIIETAYQKLLILENQKPSAYKSARGTAGKHYKQALLLLNKEPCTEVDLVAAGIELLHLTAYLNMLNEMHELVEMKFIPLEQYKLLINPLLHIAAQEGHFEVSTYLVKMIGSDPNSLDRGIRPLHDTVIGDNGFSPVKASIGHSHARVAKFLLQHGADPSLRSFKKLTPSDMTRNHRPNYLEILVGRKFVPRILGPSAHQFPAETVRPVLDKHLSKRGNRAFFSPGAELVWSNLKTFRLFHAMKSYVKTGVPGFDYEDVESMLNDFRSISSEEFIELDRAFSNLSPKPATTDSELHLKTLLPFPRLGVLFTLGVVLFAHIKGWNLPVCLTVAVACAVFSAFIKFLSDYVTQLNSDIHPATPEHRMNILTINLSKIYFETIGAKQEPFEYPGNWELEAPRFN